MKQFCREGHIAFSYLLLSKTLTQEKIKIDHTRDQALFLSLSTFDLLDFQPFIEKFRPQLERQIIRDLSITSQDMQNIMMLIQSAVILNFDISKHINIQNLVDQIISCQLPNGCFAPSTEPNCYSDVRNVCLALVSLYLLKIRYDVDVSKVNITSTRSYLESLTNPDFFIAQSPHSEGHAGGVFLVLISYEMIKRLFNVEFKREHKRRLVNRLVNLQQFLLAGRPNKLPCLCYHLWSYGSLKLLGKENLLNHQSLLRMTLESQYQVNLSNIPIESLSQPKLALSDCETKKDFIAYLNSKNTVFMGFGADGEDPDALHTFTPLMYLAGEKIIDSEIDFATFLTVKRLELWKSK